MEQIKMIATSICVTAVITGIFTLLVPNNSFDKVMRFSISLFFIAAIVSPIFTQGLKFDFNFNINELQPTPEIVSLKAVSDNKVLDLAKGSIEKQLKSKLSNKYDNIKSVDVILDSKENTKSLHNQSSDSIFISKVVIVLTSELKDDNEVPLKKIVSNELNVLFEDIVIIQNSK